MKWGKSQNLYLIMDKMNAISDKTKKINHNNVVIYWSKCVYLHYVINGNTHSDTPHGKNSNLNNAVFMCFC